MYVFLCFTKNCLRHSFTVNWHFYCQVEFARSSGNRVERFGSCLFGSCLTGRSGLVFTSSRNSCRVALSFLKRHIGDYVVRDADVSLSICHLVPPKVSIVALHDCSTHLRYVLFGPCGPLFLSYEDPCAEFATFLFR